MFVCDASPPLSPSSHTRTRLRTLSPQERLEAIAEHYTNTKSKLNKNEFKLKIYRKAVGTLKQLDFRVTTAAQLLKIVDARGKSRLGKSVIETCAEILGSGQVGALYVAHALLTRLKCFNCVFFMYHELNTSTP